MFIAKLLASHEKIHGIIMNYVGFPAASFNSFQQDSGLAQLISVMAAHRSPVKVIDLASTEVVRRMRPPYLQQWLGRIWKNIQERTALGRLPSLSTVLQLVCVNALSFFYQRSLENKIAQQMIREITETRPEFFAAKLWMGDSFTGTMRIISAVHRRFPQLPVVVGGPLALPAAREVLDRYPAVTYVISGEADIALPYLQEVLQGKRAVATVPNLVYRYANGAIGHTPALFVHDLRSFVMPRDLSPSYQFFKGALPLATLTIDSGRGCNNHCLYCVIPAHQGRRRERTPKQIVDQMERAFHEHTVRYFRLGAPNTSPELLDGIAAELLKRGLCDFTWTAFTDIVQIDEAIIRKAVKAGLAALFMGIESTDPVFQRTFTPKKLLPYDKVVETVHMLKRHGLFVTGSFIIGYPGETAAAWEENRRLIKECLFDSVLLNPFAVFPEAEVFRKKMPGIGRPVSEERYRRMLMHFKVNLLLPFLMKDLPYTIDGRSLKELVSLMVSRQQELEAEGIVVGIDGDLGVLAGKLGLPARDFVAASKEMFFTGNADEIEKSIQLINMVLAGRADRP